MFVISKVKIGSDEQYMDYQYSEKEARAQQRQSQEQRDKRGNEVSSDARQASVEMGTPTSSASEEQVLLKNFN